MRYKPFKRAFLLAAARLSPVKVSPERQLEIERKLAAETGTSIPSLRRQFQIEMGLPEMSDEEFERQFIHGQDA